LVGGHDDPKTTSLWAIAGLERPARSTDQQPHQQGNAQHGQGGEEDAPSTRRVPRCGDDVVECGEGGAAAQAGSADEASDQPAPVPSDTNSQHNIATTAGTTDGHRVGSSAAEVAVTCSRSTRRPQVQALDRTQPVLPLDFGKAEQRTHDYIRHGTTNLFAALNTATGEITGKCFDRRRTIEFLKFMDQVVAAHSDQELHIVLDNLSTHKGDDVDTWLAKHPKVTFHFTPTGSS